MRLVRMELYCAARSAGYGPSSAYTMGGYATPDRVSASRNAQRLEQNEACIERIVFLTARPKLAKVALAEAQLAKKGNLDKHKNSDGGGDGKNRNKLDLERPAPSSISKPKMPDHGSLVDLLEHILVEARGLVDRCRADGADSIMTKSAIDLHRSAIAAREKFVGAAKDADHQLSARQSDQTPNSLYVYVNMQHHLGISVDPPPVQKTKTEPVVFTTVDEEHLYYNIDVTLEQIDNLSNNKVPELRSQIRLYETLLKSVTKLCQIVNRSVARKIARPSRTTYKMDPEVILRWFALNNIAM